MERIISEQDRIRRAEEIAGRRRGTISARDINVEHTKKKMPLLTKVFIQQIVSMCIFGIAYFLVQHNNPAIESIRNILGKDANIGQIYNEFNNKFQSLSTWYSRYINNENNINQNSQENNQEENINEVNQIENVLNENSIDSNIVNSNVVGIGGSDEILI